MFCIKPTKEPRDRFINAALDLFYGQGIWATEIDDIADHAGLPASLLLIYFQSKEDLVSAFLEKCDDIWLKWFETEVEKRFAETGGRLEIIASVLQSWFERPKYRGCAFINLVAEGWNSASKPFEIAREHKERLRGILERLCVRMNFADPQATASAALVVIEGVIIRAQMTGNSAEAQNAYTLFQCLNHT